jgi:hypothetical protein
VFVKEHASSLILKMEKPIPRDLAVIQNPLIKNEADLEAIVELVDYKNFSWGSYLEGVYCPTGIGGIYWLLRSLGESIGIKQDSTFCDIGFGSATVLATFAILGYKTYGIDMREQPLKHAPDFFSRVQEKFGKFRHYPELMLGELKQDKPAEFIFGDGRAINNMDLYYSFINNEPESMPQLMKSINPGQGSIAIQEGGYFHTAKRLELIDKECIRNGWERQRNIPTYDSMRFTLINQDKQRQDLFEEDGSGVMQEAYSALFLKQ